MKHWQTTIHFEAWDEEDAARMIQRMLRPVDEERRLLYATNPEPSTEMLRDDLPEAVRPSEELA